jgi:CAAX protease family protein
VSTTGWRAVAGLEVLVATVLVVLDVGIPSLELLALAAASLAVRRTGFRSLGFRRLSSPARTVGAVLVLTVTWSLLEIGLVMPVANRVSGSHQDLSTFEDLQGNLPLLLVLLLASWVLGALAEETVFRGYLPTRIRDLGRDGDRALRTLAVVVPAVLFALLHLEQGPVGVLLTFLDALFFTFLRTRFASVWAAVLGHGFNNTIGICTFFVVGPIYGLW